MQGRCIIVPTPDKKSYPTIAKTNCRQTKILTRGNKTKRKGKVEDVDIHFRGNNSFDEPDFGNKDKEADNEGKDYSKHYTAISHHTEKRKERFEPCIFTMTKTILFQFGQEFKIR